jgi:hypothetical protein
MVLSIVAADQSTPTSAPASGCDSSRQRGAVARAST